jgi:hypothetical protein
MFISLIFFYPSLSRTFPLELSIVYSLFCPVQIWGAGLCGWVGPVSPLEVLTGFIFLLNLNCSKSLLSVFGGLSEVFIWFQVSRTVSLLLHGNGTYRAHWADRLGFCKHPFVLSTGFFFF